ncbi:MAG: hypothetical protein ACRDQ5_09785 [Sciscionella sp.]
MSVGSRKPFFLRARLNFSLKSATSMVLLINGSTSPTHCLAAFESMGSASQSTSC